MLIATLNGQRIDAHTVERGHDYHCPGCGNPVILKRGRIVIAHFAHKPPVNCNWAKGETRAHLEAKRYFKTALNHKGLTAEIEYIVERLNGDRRADVMVWAPNGDMLAIELQHSSLSLPNIEERAFSYASANIAQIWIPFIDKKVFEKAEYIGLNQCVIKKYPAKDFEKWIHGFNMGKKRGLWMYEPSAQKLYQAMIEKAEYYVPESSWYEDGQEVTVGGYPNTYKKYRKLTINGPYALENLNLMLTSRKQKTLSHYNWPAGRIGCFSPNSS